jgi:hypothetical protein
LRVNDRTQSGKRISSIVTLGWPGLVNMPTRSTQPKVSSLMRGDFANLSERKLMDCLNRLGYDIEIHVRPTSDPVGHLRLAIA